MYDSKRPQKDRFLTLITNHGGKGMSKKITLFSPDHNYLHQLVEVEKLAWNSPGALIAASSHKIARRIQSYPKGVTLAVLEDGRAGTMREAVGSQYAFRLDWDGDPNKLKSWDEHTAEGDTASIHNPKGNTGFLVGVGVVPEFRGQHLFHNLSRPNGSFKASELLIARTLDALFDDGVSQVIANARIPAYHTRPNLDVFTYCHLVGADSRPYDPVLRFHLRMGAKILKPVEYAMHDAESLNGGCWVLYQKRFVG